MADAAALFTKGVPRDQTPVRSEEIRNNFAALAATFFTTRTSEPTSPEKGYLRIIDEVDNPSFAGNLRLQFYDGAAWRTVLQNMQGGVAAPAKIVAEFTTPLASWVVDHNLGSRVLALVFDSSWNLLKGAHLGSSPRTTISVGHVPASVLTTRSGVQQLRAAIPLPFTGRILRTYAVAAEDKPVADGQIEFELSGAGGPLVGGEIPLNAAVLLGDELPGAPVTAANVFALGDTLEVRTNVTTPPASGSLDVYVEVERSLPEGSYTLQQVNDNRIIITHPAAISGFVVLIG